MKFFKNRINQTVWKLFKSCFLNWYVLRTYILKQKKNWLIKQVFGILLKKLKVTETLFSNEFFTQIRFAQGENVLLLPSQSQDETDTFKARKMENLIGLFVCSFGLMGHSLCYGHCAWSSSWYGKVSTFAWYYSWQCSSYSMGKFFLSKRNVFSKLSAECCARRKWNLRRSDFLWKRWVIEFLILKTFLGGFKQHFSVNDRVFKKLAMKTWKN